VHKDSELSEHSALNSERCARNSELSEHNEQNSALSERSARNSEPSFHQHIQIFRVLFYIEDHDSTKPSSTCRIVILVESRH
jgi:hypothetical protein